MKRVVKQRFSLLLLLLVSARRNLNSLTPKSILARANTCCAWAGGTRCAVSLIFAIIVSFMLFIVFTLANVLCFEEFLIHDSRGFMILKNN